MDIVLNQPHTGVFWAYDSLNQPLIGEEANFVAEFVVNGLVASKAIVINEVDPINRAGCYHYSFTPDEKRDWYLHITLPPKDDLGWECNFRVVDKLAEDINLENLGPGDRTVEVFVQDDDTLGPIVNAWVEVYDDTSTTKIAYGLTGADGKITFQLFDGNYKVYISAIGQYVFTVPEDLTVISDQPPPDVSVTYQGSRVNPATPPAPDLCTVYGWELTPDGVGAAVEVEAEILSSRYFLQSNPHVIRSIKTTSDPNHSNGPGYWELTISKTVLFAGTDEVRYKFSIDEQRQGDYAIPDQASIAFKDLIGL